MILLTFVSGGSKMIVIVMKLLQEKCLKLTKKIDSNSLLNSIMKYVRLLSIFSIKWIRQYYVVWIEPLSVVTIERGANAVGMIILPAAITESGAWELFLKYITNLYGVGMGGYNAANG